MLTVAVSDDDGALAALHATLWEALEALGFEREERRFRPHLTVARVRRGWTPSTARAAADAGAAISTCAGWR